MNVCLRAESAGCENPEKRHWRARKTVKPSACLVVTAFEYPKVVIFLLHIWSSLFTQEL